MKNERGHDDGMEGMLRAALGVKKEKAKSKSPMEINPSHKGLLHKDLGVKQGAPIPEKKLEKGLHSNDPAEKKRAVFAENAKHWNHGNHGG